MKITHVNDWKGHTVIIDCEIVNSNYDAKATVQVIGSGKTKAEAVKNGLIAIDRLDSEIKEMREKLSAL